MTVRNLKEILSHYDNDIQIYIHIEDITDDYGHLIDSTAKALTVINGSEMGIRNGILICGIE